MAKEIIRLEQVSKKYHGSYAVEKCNLYFEQGKIYGLVGRNGAGKTTIMRMIAGLGIPTEGNIVRCKDDKIGMLIEAPGLNNGMTAMENLKFYRLLSGKGELREKDEELLELVGLDATSTKKVKNYSMGMKQRLGIAVALIGNPEFVMLDEPVNGLDPIGVVEVRELVKKLAAEKGMTVLISSHNLPELYQTASDYIIIDKGRVKKVISHEKLESECAGNLEEYFLKTIEKK